MTLLNFECVGLGRELVGEMLVQSSDLMQYRPVDFNDAV